MHRASILADSFEALVGAVYLDGGFEVAREVIKAQFDWDKLQTVSADGLKDSKTDYKNGCKLRTCPCRIMGCENRGKGTRQGVYRAIDSVCA